MKSLTLFFFFLRKQDLAKLFYLHKLIFTSCKNQINKFQLFTHPVSKFPYHLTVFLYCSEIQVVNMTQVFLLEQELPLPPHTPYFSLLFEMLWLYSPLKHCLPCESGGCTAARTGLLFHKLQSGVGEYICEDSPYKPLSTRFTSIVKRNLPLTRKIRNFLVRWQFLAKM